MVRDLFSVPLKFCSAPLVSTLHVLRHAQPKYEQPPDPNKYAWVVCGDVLGAPGRSLSTRSKQMKEGLTFPPTDQAQRQYKMDSKSGPWDVFFQLERKYGQG